MSSSSSHDADDLIEDPVVILKCKCPGSPDARLREAWTVKNPARRFFNCKNSLVPFARKCQFYKWVDDQIPKHYRIVLHRLKNLVDAMELQAVRSQLQAVRTELVNAQTQIAIQTQLLEIEKETVAATILELKGEVETLTTANSAMKVKMKKGLRVFVGSLVVVAGIGTWVVMHMEMKKPKEMLMLWG